MTLSPGKLSLRRGEFSMPEPHEGKKVYGKKYFRFCKKVLDFFKRMSIMKPALDVED